EGGGGLGASSLPSARRRRLPGCSRGWSERTVQPPEQQPLSLRERIASRSPCSAPLRKGQGVDAGGASPTPRPEHPAELEQLLEREPSATKSPFEGVPLSRGWTIVLAILTVGIGLLVPLTIYFWRRGQRTSAYISAGVFGFFALLVVIAAATGGSSNSRNSANQSTPQQPSTTQQSTQTQSTQTQTHTSAPPPTEARFVLVIGKSACGEDPCVAYINCHVAVRNAGGTAGDAPDV